MGNTGIDAADKEVIKSEKAFTKRITTDLVKTSTFLPESSIKDYLERPVLIETGNFTLTDTATTFPNHKVLNTILSNDAYKRKLDGYYSMRADVKLKLVVNGNRFQQGRYILAFKPQQCMLGVTSASVNRNCANQIIQLPHVELDISCNTEVELYIPFQHFVDSFYLGNIAALTNNDIGYYFLYPYSTLVSPAGSTTCGYRIFASLHNVELYGATIPQSGFRRGQKKKDPIETEAKVKMDKPVSKSFRFIADVSSALAPIPLLSSIAAPVSWVSDALARAAESFGWSRPRNMEQASKMWNIPSHGAANVDAVDNSETLALTQNNYIETPAGFAGTDLDEMSFDFIKSIYGLHGTGTWNTSSAVDDIIYTFDLRPRHFYNTVISGTNTFYSQTPIAFLCSFFAFWRGGVNIRIKFVKTEFHSGRILVTYLPYDARFGAGTPPQTTTTSVYALREIVDVRDGNEFTFNIPYCATTPWYPTNGAYPGPGRFNVTVLDPLVAPANVSSSITVLVEVAGAPDFQVAVPINNTAQVVASTVLQSGFKRNPCSIDGDISNYETYDSLAPQEICIGEHIRSFRQLVKRPTLIGTNLGEISPVYASKYVTCFPTFTVVRDNAGTLTLPTHSPDLLSIVAGCYGLYRGGMNYKVYLYNTASDMIVASLHTYPYSQAGSGQEPVNASTIVAGSTGTSTQIFRLSPSGCADLNVPYYGMTHSKSVYAHQVATGTMLSTLDYWNTNLYTNSTTMYLNSLVDADWLIYRSAADDFSFGQFISVPLVDAI